MKHLFTLLPTFLLICCGTVSAQVLLPVGTTSIDFTGFTAAGFAPTPAAGQLDSDSWIVTGMSSGAVSPGGTATTGDFARGTTDGTGETTGGLYALDTDPSIWIQQTGSDMLPGSVRLLVENNTGATMTTLAIAYDLIEFNDQDRSSTIDFSYSTGGFAGTFTTIPGLQLITEELQDGVTTTFNRGTTITGLSIPNGGTLALSWDYDELPGTGSRDEIGLDNIQLTPGNTVTADRLTYKNTPASATRGLAFTIDVCATDAASNDDTGYATDITIADDGTSTAAFAITPAATQAPTNGCATFTITPTTSGVISVNATSGSLSAGTTPYNFFITVLSGLNIYLSEYVEGSSTNKCIEIYNGTGGPIDLAAGGYFLSQFSNGGTSTSSGSPIALSGIIAAGDVHVICNTAAGPDFLNQVDQTTDFLTYSGNDGILLGATSIGVLDFIGNTTSTVGSAWTGSGCSTQDQTLVRKSTVTTGDPNTRDAFDPSVEWDCSPQDTWAYIGNHGTPISATTLAYYVSPPSNCLEVNGYFRVEVCAQDANGFPQPDFANDITLSLGSGTGPLNVAGSATQTPSLGCATFYVRNQSAGNIIINASATGVSSATTSSISIASTCAEASPLTGVFDPCGTENQNEFVVGQNGSGTLDINSLSIGQIDPIAGIQPNYNFTWRIDGMTTSDNPDMVCNASSNVCNRLLNVNTPADEAILLTLQSALNTQAGCTLFQLPTKTGTGGEIPADAYFIVFLGAGGDGTVGSEGFDGLGTNLDFSGFCSGSISTVYLLAGVRSSAATGFFNNTASRTYRMITGTSIRDLEYPVPAGGNQAQSISADGTLFAPASLDCTPDFLFDASPFPVELLSFFATPVSTHAVLLEWTTASETQNDRFIVQRSRDRLMFEDIGEVNGAGTTQLVQRYNFTDHSPIQGINYYRLIQVDYDGTMHPSPLAEAHIAPAEAFAVLEAYPNPTEDRFTLKIQVPEAGELHISFYTRDGRKAHHFHQTTEAGITSIQSDLSHLAAGLYTYDIRLNGRRLSGRFIRQ